MSKAKITEEMLRKHSIPILDKSKLINDYINIEPLVITGFGKFYKRIYDGKEVILKIVDISLSENIINEFILWKKYQNSPNFLKLKGVILYYNLAYIIFEDCFKYTLESMLLSQNKKLLDEKQKIEIAKQILDVLNTIQKNNAINKDLRPGTLIITSEEKVKLIDFGLMLQIPDFTYKEQIKNNQIKYSPPEYLLENKINNSYDIYSFGCILIDLFSNDINDTILNKTIEEYDDYINEIKENKYPKIPEDINYLLQEIIKNCLNKEPKQRIKMNELYYNLNNLLNNLNNIDTNNNYINNINMDLINEDLIENEQYIELKNLYEYSKEINSESIKYENIDNDLKSKIEKMKKDLDNGLKNSLIELNKLKEKLKSKIDDVINQNQEIIKTFYNKTLENIIYFMDLLSNSMADIDEIKKIAPEMQILLLSYNKFINRNKYKNVENIIQQWKKDIEKKVKKYTNNKYFDIIDISFAQCSKFFHKNEELINNYYIELDKLYENIKNMKGFFGDDDQIEKELDDQLLIQKLINDISSGVDLEEIQKENEQNINSMTKNIYAKIVENSNMISIFNYNKKEIKNYVIFSEKEQKNNNFRFNSNCFSLYNPEKNYIYISGGIKDLRDQNSHDNSFYRLDISINKDNKSNININKYNNLRNVLNKSMQYEFKLNKLSNMNNARSYHSMINLSSNKNIILSISGINTDSCEVYNVDYDKWINIQELPMKCQNPGIIDYNNYIFVFPYSPDYHNIYRLNMNNENDEFIWESIKYSIDEGYLKKGMAVIPDENNLYLLGGYDNQGNYSHIYGVELDNENNDFDIKLSNELSLPNEINFSSNYIKFNLDKEKENENDNEDIALIMDNYNGVLEFNINSGEFKYYLGK